MPHVVVRGLGPGLDQRRQAGHLGTFGGSIVTLEWRSLIGSPIGCRMQRTIGEAATHNDQLWELAVVTHAP
jgi:hypothetical protein